MLGIVTWLLLFVALLLGGLLIWLWADHCANNSLWRRLVAMQPVDPPVFDTGILTDLPEPAQRFFRFAIRPGTPLYSVSEISMQGDFSLGSKSNPNYMPMRARQIIAAPRGFIWQVKAGKFPMVISGSDAAEDGVSWSRFWLFGILPVARAGGNPDHARAAFGRYVAEAVFWSPAALLPDAGAKWQAVDTNTARVTLQHNGLQQAVEVTVDGQGRPVKIRFQRWSDANDAKKYQLQPFGGYLSGFRDFEGFQLPTRVEAGNFFETEDYFPFFRVDVTQIRFPKASEVP